MFLTATRPVSGRAAVALGVLGTAVLVRHVVAAGRPWSITAALASSAVMIVGVLLAGPRGSRRRPPAAAIGTVGAGLAGAAVLVAGPAARLTLSGRVPPGHGGSLPAWAATIAVVAVSEEALVRGALWVALARTSEVGALVVTTVAFALMHVPLYGWRAVPLDLAVGLWLGGLRLVTGSVTAPAVAHTVADWAAWWLV